jgi:hypothetical protein
MTRACTPQAPKHERLHSAGATNTAHGRSTSMNKAYLPIREQQRDQLAQRLERFLPTLT